MKYFKFTISLIGDGRKSYFQKICANAGFPDAIVSIQPSIYLDQENDAHVLEVYIPVDTNKDDTYVIEGKLFSAINAVKHPSAPRALEIKYNGYEQLEENKMSNLSNKISLLETITKKNVKLEEGMQHTASSFVGTFEELIGYVNQKYNVHLVKVNNATYKSEDVSDRMGILSGSVDNSFIVLYAPGDHVKFSIALHWKFKTRGNKDTMTLETNWY